MTTELERTTPEDIEAAIASEFYFTAEDGVLGYRHGHRMLFDRKQIKLQAPSLSLLTFCVLVLKDGSTVTGWAIGPTEKSDDSERCMALAKADAVRKMALTAERDRLARALEYIVNASSGGELFPVGCGEVVYAEDGNTVIRRLGPWRFLRGVGDTFLEAVEDEMRKPQ